MQPLSLSPIGYIRTPFVEKFSTPRQASLTQIPAIIELEKNSFSSAAIKDLEGISHIWVLYVFHLNQNLTLKAKVRPPRSKLPRSLFATRTPHRPNPIGLSLVRLLKIDGATLFIEGVDMVDGSPILDIKPYISAYDRPKGKVSSGWVDKLEPVRTLKVRWQKEALSQLKGLQKSSRRKYITELLRLDPRPRPQRDQKRIFAFYYENMNIHVKYSLEICSVIKVEKAEV